MLSKIKFRFMVYWCVLKHSRLHWWAMVGFGEYKKDNEYWVSLHKVHCIKCRHTIADRSFLWLKKESKGFKKAKKKAEQFNKEQNAKIGA